MLVWTGILSDGVLGFSGRIHNIVDYSCIPCHTILLLYMIKNLYLSYDTLNTELNKIFMDNKEVWARPGTTCACMADFGSHVRSKFPVYVDCSVLPSGRFMTRGRVSGLILLSEAPGRINPPVAPASKMALLASIFILDALSRVSFSGDSMLSME